MLRKKLAAAVAASLLMASSSAVAQSAQSLGLTDAPVRASAEVDGNQMDGGGYTIWVIGAIVLGLVIWGAIELLDDDEGPVSP